MSTAIRFLVFLVLAGTGLAAGWYLTNPARTEVHPVEIVWTGQAADSWALLRAYEGAPGRQVTYRVGGEPRIALDDPPEIRTLPDGSTGIVVRARSTTPDPTHPDSWILVEVDGQVAAQAEVIVRAAEGVAELPAEPSGKPDDAQATAACASCPDGKTCASCPVGEAKPGCCGRCAADAAAAATPATCASCPDGKTCASCPIDEAEPGCGERCAADAAAATPAGCACTDCGAGGKPCVGCVASCASGAPLGKPAADGSGPECELPPFPEQVVAPCGLCPQGCVHAISPDEPLPVVGNPSAE